jgi:hypothetical protein
LSFSHELTPKTDLAGVANQPIQSGVTDNLTPFLDKKLAGRDGGLLNDCTEIPTIIEICSVNYLVRSH